MTEWLRLSKLDRLLASVNLFEPLTPGALRALARGASLERLEAGEGMMVEPREHARRVIVLLAGRAAVHEPGPTATNFSADELDGEDSGAFLPSRIYTVSAFREIQPGTGAGAVAYCDAGDLAVSGGYRDLNANLDIYSAQRVDENTNPENGSTQPSGWQVVASNPPGGTAGAVDAYAYCADQPPAHTR